MSEPPDPVTGAFAIPTTITDQIGCVRRELRLRQKIYPSLITKGKLPREVANREYALMHAVLATLRAIEAAQQ